MNDASEAGIDLKIVSLNRRRSAAVSPDKRLQQSSSSRDDAAHINARWLLRGRLGRATIGRFVYTPLSSLSFSLLANEYRRGSGTQNWSIIMPLRNVIAVADRMIVVAATRRIR